MKFLNKDALDQFFTLPEVAERCAAKVFEVMRNEGLDPDAYQFVEPSAGAGAFLPYLPADTWALDLEPRASGIARADFLEWTPPSRERPLVFVGNPPFGFRGARALDFLRHAVSFADAVGFILPPSFQCLNRKRVKGATCIYNEELNWTFPFIHAETGEKVRTTSYFQVYLPGTHRPWFSEYGPNGDVEIHWIMDRGSGRNGLQWIGKCDFYLRSSSYKSERLVHENFSTTKGHQSVGLICRTPDIKRRVRAIDWEPYLIRNGNGAMRLNSQGVWRALHALGHARRLVKGRDLP